MYKRQNGNDTYIDAALQYEDIRTMATESNGEDLYPFRAIESLPGSTERAPGENMTFRISDLLIRGCLIIIGLTEVAHLAGCLLGWSFLAVTELLLAEIAVAVLVLILSGLIAHKNSIIGKPAPENSKTSGRQQILTVVLVFFILLQVLWILTGERVWTDGDMTLETVNTFLKENSIYTVDPLTGEPYTQGMSFRLKLLCLPTLYGTISRWSGMTPETVVYRLIPCLTLCMGHLLSLIHI